MDADEKSLRNAVKNAKTAYYKDKGKTKKVFRKEVRRKKRKEKKANQHQYQLKKHGKQIMEEKPIEEKKKKRKKRKRKAPKEEEANEEDELTYERYAYEAANKQDEQLIASLGKKLGLSKSKDLKKGFEQDGLDFLFEVCEPLTGGAEDLDGENSDEEYLRNKKAKKLKKEKANKKSKQQSSPEEEIKDKLLFEDGIGDEEEKEGGGELDDFEQGLDAEEGGGELDDFEQGLDADFAGLEGGDSEDESMSGEMDDNESEGEEIGEEETFDDGDKEEFDDVDEHDDEETQEEEKTEPLRSEPLGKYMPPSLRRLQTKGVDAEKLKIERLKKQLKGLLNRVSEPSLPGITSDIEMLYERNSRNTMNELLYELVLDSCVADSLTPQRLVIQLIVIIAALHKTSQCEIGSYFLQMFVEKFAALHQLDDSKYDPGKQCANIVYLIVTMYSFKVVDSLLIYDIVRRLLKRFNEQDIELLLIILKACGTDMRKDDPGALKEIILEVQAKSISSDIKDQSRVKFMLETINALKNNNMRKVPQYDPTLIEEGRKIYKAITRGRETMNSGSQLKVSLEDLLNAREKGKWWVIGSAWAGRGPIQNRVVDKTPEDGDKEITADASEMLLEKAKKQRMNTGLRKNIFCILMTSEDYLDAFKKLQKLSLNEIQGREIIHVLLDCCLQEKTYNPFYAHLADQFCEHSHSNKVTLQYSLWDRFKTLSTLSKHTTRNMANLLAHSIASKSLTLAVLKVVSFGVLDKPSIRFFTLFFNILLLQYPENSVKIAFKKLSTVPKLSLLREGIKVFMRHFLTPRSDSTENNVKDRKMIELIELAEAALDGQDYVPL